MTPYYADDLVTIYHGDAREAPLVMLGDVLVTDPPYGRALAFHGGRDRRWRRQKDWGLAGDADGQAGQSVLDSWGDLPAVVFAHPMQPWAGRWSQHLAWDKGDAVGGGGDTGSTWKGTWELIQVQRLGRLLGGRQPSVLRFPVVQGSYRLHPAAKPVALMAYLISKLTQPVVVDPFMGSGSTLVAARTLGRRSVGIEIEERYCEIAANRCRQEVLGLVG